MNTPASKVFMNKFAYLFVLSICAAGSHAADKTLSTTPIFLQTGVQPNIMLGMDDSGSMLEETVVPDAVREAAEADAAKKNDKGKLDFSKNDVDPRNSFSRRSTNKLIILFSCAGTNRMFYDPSKTYTPWEGVDEDGFKFTDQTIKTALFNPYDNDIKVDLTEKKNNGLSYGYFEWKDRDNDGEWDPGECPTDTLSYDELSEWYTDTSEMTPDQQKNYANWYTYYRKREYVAKKALSKVVSESIARVGLKTLHNPGGVDTVITDIDDITSPQDKTAKENKAKLLKNIARIEIDKDGITPLRTMLKSVGEYFDGPNSPILAENDGGKCQQNFVIVMSDGYWNGDSPGVGNQDKEGNSKFSGGLFADKYSNTLADVAMKYYQTDLKASIANEVPIQTDIDENNAQHLVTYTVAFGLTGTLDETMGFYPDPDAKKPSDIEGFSWPEVVSGKSTSIDDMRHAAYNGRGLFLSASNPEQLIDSLTRSMNDIQDRSRSASTVAVTTGSFNGLARSFRSQFDSSHWEGWIEAVPLEWNAESGKFTYNTDGKINASKVPAPDDRHIVTYNGTKGIPFRYESLTDAQKSILNTEKLVDFIRGESESESEHGGSYRDRTIAEGSDAPLGDFINSSPAYVVDPIFRYPDDLETVPYTNYRKNPDGDGKTTSFSIGTETFTFHRTPMLYIGGNDGMLHGFRVERDSEKEKDDFGKEVFAYVPSMLIKNLPKLSSQQYQHTYMVDGTPVTGDAFFDNSWHTVLVGGLNSGGQGIYAIDVSKPQNFTSEDSAAEYVLWEFDDSDDADLGYTFSQPVIAKANTGAWVAIFGNGYNSTHNDLSTGGSVGSGNAVLYVVNLQTGKLIKKIDTGTHELKSANGLSSPTAVDINGDYTVDFVYAGDLEGNLWKFDLSAINPNSWKVAYQESSTQSKNIPLFTACSESVCDENNRQPITVKPLVTFNKEAWNGYLVYFGTGSYIFDEDKSDTSSLQSAYAVWDRNEAVLTRFNRTHLLRQKILEETTSASSEQRVVSGYKMKWHSGAGLPSDADNNSEMDSYLGWYMDFIVDPGEYAGGRPDNDPKPIDEDKLTGERSVVSVAIRNGQIWLYTLIPNTDPCSPGSDGWIMVLDPNSGGYTSSPQINVNEDSVIDSNDTLSYGGEPRPSGGFKQGKGDTTEPEHDVVVGVAACAFIVLPDGTERCVTAGGAYLSSPDTNLGRWNWKELKL